MALDHAPAPAAHPHVSSCTASPSSIETESTTRNLSHVRTGTMLSTIFLNPFGAILDLPEEDAALRMGFYPKYQAVVTASCDPPKPEITAMWPWGIKHSLNNGGWSDEKSTNEFPDITMELMNVAPTCANKYAISEPCVNHNPNAPTFFKCKYTGKAGSVRRRHHT